jgi:hypothetical protein
VVAVAAAGILVVGAQAASAGTFEVCKSGANGMAGKTFHFAVTPNAGSSVGFNITPAGSGFTCSGPQNIVGATSGTIVESDVNTTSEVASITVIPSSRKVSDNIGAKSVTVNFGTTTSNETQIRFVNQPPGGTSGTLKICKLSSTPAFVGRSFSFTVNGGPAVSTTANDAFDDPANWSCRILGSFQVGSHVIVRELVPAGAEIDFIDTDPGSALFDFSTDTATNFANVIVGTGTTIVLFDDEAIPPSGTGFIEVCKNPPGFQDAAVTGSWHFTLTDQDGNFITSRDVLTNQCTNAIQVPAGIVTVTETSRPGYQLVDVFTDPVDALVNSNLLNGTADVEVPTSSNEADEVQVNFVNTAIRSQLKICKALGPGSADLIGQTFNFNVTNTTDPSNPIPLVGNSSVQAAATTQCVIFGTIPTGTVVTVAEVFGPDNPMTPFDESGAFIDQTGPVTTTIGSGINTVTITNTARGVLEVCKDPVVGITNQPTFQFRVDNGAIFSVPGGGCSQPRRVSVGNHTVTEIAAQDYELTAITVDPASRLVGTPDLANRTVTVSVPYGPSGETVVTFTNRIKQGRFKVCKTIPLGSFDSLNGKPFNYLLYIQTGGTHAAPIFNGGGPGIPLTVNATTSTSNLTTCSGFTAFSPILQANGEKTIAAVQEQLGAGFVVDSITVSPNNGMCTFGTGLPAPSSTSPNCVPGGIDKDGTAPNGTPGFAEIDWFLAGGNLGNAAVTFTNRAT